MNKPDFPTDIPCQCYLRRVHECVCPDQEKAMRAYANRLASLRPMSEKEREWCLIQVNDVEGYARKDYEDASDRELAATVLCAWMDFCRDKGLL